MALTLLATVSGAAVLVVGLSLRHRAGGRDAVTGTATVVRVVDGDTLVVDLGGHDERVRLIGIDTPESVAVDRPAECYGAAASDRTKQLVPPGTVVHLERDLEARDHYDRLLAYVYRASDDLFVNRSLVSGGYAETLTYPPNTTHRDELARAERDARLGGNGLWSECGSADVPLG